jgi:hypothetical protein
MAHLAFPITSPLSPNWPIHQAIVGSTKKNQAIISQQAAASTDLVISRIALPLATADGLPTSPVASAGHRLAPHH